MSACGRQYPRRTIRTGTGQKKGLTRLTSGIIVLRWWGGAGHIPSDIGQGPRDAYNACDRRFGGRGISVAFSVVAGFLGVGLVISVSGHSTTRAAGFGDLRATERSDISGRGCSVSRRAVLKRQ